MKPARFDHLSSSYEELLKDPIRDYFTGSETAFFHRRKSILLDRFFRKRGIRTQTLRYLDVGCGKGELLQLQKDNFEFAAGCDVSGDMMSGIRGIHTRLQDNPVKLPFGSSEFDLITAVCVYHHIPPSQRPALTAEILRVLRPDGFLCIIEHNPRNPVTRHIVSRTPVDADAILLDAEESRQLVSRVGLRPVELQYFLYFPERIFAIAGGVESMLTRVPLGGQYGLFSQKLLAS